VYDNVLSVSKIEVADRMLIRPTSYSITGPVSMQDRAVVFNESTAAAEHFEVAQNIVNC
jgi:hypothetical protein